MPGLKAYIYATGEWILSTHTVPTHDLFSFSKPGQPWFAWEWMSDVLFAVLCGIWGLKGLVLFTAALCSAGASVGSWCAK